MREMSRVESGDVSGGYNNWVTLGFTVNPNHLNGFVALAALFFPKYQRKVSAFVMLTNFYNLVELNIDRTVQIISMAKLNNETTLLDFDYIQMAGG